MSFTVIIPARYGSTRLPGKALLDIAGKPMVQHVFERAGESSAGRVIIATDDARIEQAAQSFGAEVCMTSANHESGTDRLQEVVAKLGLADDEIIVNVQGDEPLIPAANIDQVADLLAASETAAMGTLGEAITEPAHLFDPNVVKAVSDQQGNALYFSRAAIPWSRQHFQPTQSQQDLPQQVPNTAAYLRHIGIYSYRVSFLHQFISWPPAPLEVTESLEQLRALWNGQRIQIAAAVAPPPPGVDTQADLDQVRALLA